LGKAAVELIMPGEKKRSSADSSVERSSLYIVNRKGQAKNDNVRAKFLCGCGVA
jgi:hypothetical protein